MMRLNTLKPAVGSKKPHVRVGRGIGSGLGKTCGRGHKGQKARSGYSRKNGFEGGQMPIQRRLPKFGFTSPIAKDIEEVQLRDLARIDDLRIGIAELKKANLIKSNTKRAKVILAGAVTKPVVLYGIKVTKGARSAIELAGGAVEE